MESVPKVFDEFEEGWEDAYEKFAKEDPIENHISYYSTIAHLETIQGKTFADVGCGTSPIGLRLAELGAAKVYAIDINGPIIDLAKKDVLDLGM